MLHASSTVNAKVLFSRISNIENINFDGKIDSLHESLDQVNCLFIKNAAAQCLEGHICEGRDFYRRIKKNHIL